MWAGAEVGPAPGMICRVHHELVCPDGIHRIEHADRAPVEAASMRSSGWRSGVTRTDHPASRDHSRSRPDSRPRRRDRTATSATGTGSTGPARRGMRSPVRSGATITQRRRMGIATQLRGGRTIMNDAHSALGAGGRIIRCDRVAPERDPTAHREEPSCPTRTSRTCSSRVPQSSPIVPGIATSIRACGAKSRGRRWPSAYATSPPR